MEIRFAIKNAPVCTAVLTMRAVINLCYINEFGFANDFKSDK